MNVSKVYTMDYENISNWAKRTQFIPNFSQKMQKQTQYKPKTKPIYRGVASGQAGSNPEQNELVLSLPNLFYNSLAAKNFHLILVFGWQVVFNSRFNVKNEPLSHNNFKISGDFRPPKGGPSVSNRVEVNGDGRSESIS